MSSQEGEDRRVKELVLTKAGLALCAEAEGRWQLAQDEIKQKLGLKNTELLHSLSHKIVSLKR